jgi:hypothetical protein
VPGFAGEPAGDFARAASRSLTRMWRFSQVVFWRKLPIKELPIPALRGKQLL